MTYDAAEAFQEKSLAMPFFWSVCQTFGSRNVYSASRSEFKSAEPSYG